MFLGPIIPEYCYEEQRKPKKTLEMKEILPKIEDVPSGAFNLLNPKLKTLSEYIEETSPAFFECIKRARMVPLFSDPETNITVFIPLNFDNVFLGDLTYRDFVSYSCLPNRERLDTFHFSKTRCVTLHPYNTLQIIGTENGTFLNDYSTVVVRGNIELQNGIVHFINRPVLPTVAF